MARPKKTKKYIYRNAGRKNVIDSECVRKLEEAFSVGANVKQACFYADIGRTTFYDYLKKNPDLSDRLTEIREKLPLHALRNIASRIQGQPTTGDIGLSKWLLERRMPDYRETINLNPIEETEEGDLDAHGEDNEIIKEFHMKLKGNLIKRSRERAKKEGELKE